MARFSSYFPSKTFTSTVGSLAIVVFLIAGAYLWPHKEQSTLSNSIVTPSTGQISAVITSQDTDGDGLKDWEEILWKTNPAKNDTDGDGVGDGDEIKADRNPLKAGPNDKLLVTPSGTPSSPSDKPLTATDIIARDLFSRYAQAREISGSIDQPTEQQIISTVLARSDLVNPEKRYTTINLNVIKASNGTGLKEYGNAMGVIVKKYSISNENEFLIFERAVSNETPQELKKLDPIIAAYEGMIKEMLLVTVPENAAAVHLSLLNSMSALLSNIKNMRAVYEDPASALLSLSRYLNYSTQLGIALSSINSFFKGNGVSFTKEEDGFYYVNLAS